MSTLKNRLILGAIAVFVVCMPFAANAQLIITGVFDCDLVGGVPKGVELVALADIADLSAFGLGSANNGGGSDGEEFTFPAVALTAGQFIYVASEAINFETFFGFAPDYTTSAMGINGDDAVEVFHLGAVIDTFGDINVNGDGEPWDYTDGWAYRVNETPANGGVFLDTDFNYSGLGGLDGETSNATAANPVPLGTFAFGTVATESTSWSSVKAMFN